jgi:two-component SAPR family response regulator
MLIDCRVLIAEDEAVIAADLAGAVAAVHGAVIGPFATVKEGLLFLATSHVHAAILDVELADQTVTPLAITLLERGVPVVFHTGSDIPGEVRARFGDLPICRKPMLSDHVVDHLIRTLGRAGRGDS